MLPMFRNGISALAFAAATDSGAVDYKKVRTHADLDAALGDREKPEGWADLSTADKRTWLTDHPPVAAAGKTEGDGETATQVAGAVAGAKPIVEATKEATTKENPASTTKANDPATASTVTGTTTAEENAGITQENLPGAEAGEAAGLGLVEHNDEQATGNRHSHAAETTAERSVRLADLNGADLTANAAGALPAGDDADPAKQPKPGEGAAEQESRHDESGELQRATRMAIGAGNGAPDGVGDDGADPAEAEVNALADAANGVDQTEEEVMPGMKLAGGQLKLWRALEAGATHEELKKATGYMSVLGTVDVLSRYSGRTIEKTESKAGTVYKLQPLPETDASV